MVELWGPVIAVVGLVATVVFGVQGELRGRYDRVLALLHELSTGEEVASRHRLGRYVFGGYPEIDEESRAQLVQDFFVVAAGVRRLRATLTSVRSPVLSGPSRLLAESTTGMVRFMSANIEELAARLALVDVGREVADVRAVEDSAARLRRATP